MCVFCLCVRCVIFSIPPDIPTPWALTHFCSRWDVVFLLWIPSHLIVSSVPLSFFSALWPARLRPMSFQHTHTHTYQYSIFNTFRKWLALDRIYVCIQMSSSLAWTNLALELRWAETDGLDRFNISKALIYFIRASFMHSVFSSRLQTKGKEIHHINA